MPERPRRVRIAAAVLVFLAIAVLALRTTSEVIDRRDEGFCRRDPGIPGAAPSEEWRWWPLGDRCFLTFADGSERVRDPGWSLTVLVPAWLSVAAVGLAAPPRSVRRSLAVVVAVPFVALGLLALVTVSPRSLTRVVGLSVVSLGWALPPAVPTAVGVWFTTRGRPLLIALAAWTGWAVAIFLAGREGASP